MRDSIAPHCDSVHRPDVILSVDPLPRFLALLLLRHMPSERFQAGRQSRFVPAATEMTAHIYECSYMSGLMAMKSGGGIIEPTRLAPPQKWKCQMHIQHYQEC